MALPISHWNQGPDIDTLEILLASLIDTAEAPDTIFQEFFSLSKEHIPVFPDATLIDPGVTVFAGDMGLYIG